MPITGLNYLKEDSSLVMTLGSPYAHCIHSWNYVGIGIKFARRSRIIRENEKRWAGGEEH